MRLLDRVSRVGVLGVVWALMALVAWLDYVTGVELSFSIFYLVPLLIGAWYLGSRPAWLLSLAAAVLWWGVDHLGGRVYSHPAIGYWNAFVRLGFFVVVVYLLSLERRELNRIRELSRHDPLTGAVNRRFLYELAEAELERLRRYGRPLTLVYIDLDNFKTVNDRMGHEQGDRLLQEVVRALRAGLRKPDIVCRLGGDEFAILMPETDSNQARGAVERLSARVAEAMRAREWPVTLSVGAVTAREPVALEDLVKTADALMYEAKQGGKAGARYSEVQGVPEGVP